ARDAGSAPDAAIESAAGAPRAASPVAMTETYLEAGGLRGLLATPVAGPDAACLQLEGCIDSTSCDALEALLDGALAGAGLVIDLGEVAYVSSRGWGLLAAASAKSKQGLALSRMRPDVA